MNDHCVEPLTDIVKSKPANEWLDAKILQHALGVQCAGRRLEHEVTLIVQGLEAGVPQALLRAGSQISRTNVDDLVSQLNLSSVSDGNSGRWVIAVWATALGFSTSTKGLYDNHNLPPPPEVITTLNSITEEIVRYDLNPSGDLVRGHGKSLEIVSQLRGAGVVKPAAPKKTHAESPKRRRQRGSFGQVKGACALILFMVAGCSIFGAMHVTTHSSELVVLALCSSIVAIVFLLINTCPSCKSTNISVISRQQIQSYYLHQRKDGGADRRFSYNPLVQIFRVSHKCSDCNKTWDTTEKRQ